MVASGKKLGNTGWNVFFNPRSSTSFITTGRMDFGALDDSVKVIEKPVRYPVEVAAG
jgi:hypothetical protein